jgi:hypothetical protein
MTRCDHCGAELHKQPSAINRAAAVGARLFCNRTCAGLARRSGKSAEQKKAEKAAYDAKRRTELADQIKTQKREIYLRNREHYLRQHTEYRNRPENVARHNAYCRRPEYVAEKREYDRRRRAVKQFGEEFAESFLLLQDIEKEIDSRATRYEIYLANGTINKAQSRRRALT